MLEERKILDRVEVSADGVIFTKELNQILKDGAIISSIPHRTPLLPGDDLSDNPHQLVKDIAKIHWTKKLVTDFKKQLEENMKPPSFK